jgi:hypothetical protein
MRWGAGLDARFSSVRLSQYSECNRVVRVDA